MRKYLFLLAFSLFSFSCMTAYRWNFQLQEPKPSEKMTYSDDFIDARFVIRETQFEFDIQNKTESGIKINWDELSMVYPSGKSSRVIHGGVRLMDRNSPQAPSVIPPKAKVSDILIPSENIYYASGTSDGWKVRPLFGGDDRLSWDGKEFGIYFPLEIKDAKKEYSFKFRINVTQEKDRSHAGYRAPRPKK